MTTTTLKFPFVFDAGRLQDDVERFANEEWTRHFNIHTYEGEWSVIPLRSLKGSDLPIAPDPFAKQEYFETEMMSRCCYVPQVLKAFKCELNTVRFLKLAAGATIKRHRDYRLGFEDGFIRVHIPILTNSEVDFVLNDQHLTLKEGETWYLNVNYHHSVSNRGLSDRIHLVLDCIVNDWVSEFFS